MQYPTTNEPAQHLTPAEYKAEFIHWLVEFYSVTGELTPELKTISLTLNKAEAIETYNSIVCGNDSYTWGHRPFVPADRTTWAMLATNMRALCRAARKCAGAA